MNRELAILDGGSPAILRTRQWIYVLAGIFLVLSLAISGEMRVAAMIPLVLAAVALPRFASAPNRLFCALSIDVGVTLGAWWLFGPSSGTDFISMIVVAIASLVFEGRRRALLVGMVMVEGLLHMPLHFWAKADPDLLLFHPPGQVTGDSEFVAGVFLRLGLLALAAVLLALVGESFRSLVRSKDEFVASISHEVRTPLTAVVGFSGILETSWRELPEHEVEMLIHHISHQSGEMSTIVEDLLVIARADIGSVTLIPSQLTLADEMQLILGGLTGKQAERIAVDCNQGEVWADPIRFRQVLRNLVGNALRYGGDHIRVWSETSGDSVAINVDDDGDGVLGDPEPLFEPYSRAHESPTQPASVGLGLAVSRSLARAMGGDIVYERLDGITRFKVTMPASGPSRAPTDSERLDAEAMTR
ncbi:MAG: HAMP domain-containing sensor histidine kinase [Acidimicrobiia bacterium]|nr:HAMP domain-containing sensor histidine kinase [Acidimicrobiia bacterium]